MFKTSAIWNLNEIENTIVESVLLLTVDGESNSFTDISPMSRFIDVINWIFMKRKTHKNSL